MKVESLLANREPCVHAIDKSQTVEDAISMMADKHISALIVMDQDRPVGIFTERDVLKVHLKFPDKPFTNLSVGDGMTENLIVARMDDELSNVMSAMIQADIRHMPVLSEGRLVGLLSVRDIIQNYVGSLKAELHYLQDYVSRLEDAMHD